MHTGRCWGGSRKLREAWTDCKGSFALGIDENAARTCFLSQKQLQPTFQRLFDLLMFWKLTGIVFWSAGELLSGRRGKPGPLFLSFALVCADIYVIRPQRLSQDDPLPVHLHVAGALDNEAELT